MAGVTMTWRRSVCRRAAAACGRPERRGEREKDGRTDGGTAAATGGSDAGDHGGVTTATAATTVARRETAALHGVMADSQFYL